MKHYIILTFILVLIGCSGNKKHQNEDTLETIPFDFRKAKPETDITFAIDTNYFEIIPLETNDECLISEITKISISNNKIVIYDERMKGAYIFNRDGSFHAKVRAIGQGPGEYPPIVNDIMVSKTHIGVLVPTFGIMLYDFDGKFIRKIPLDGTWGFNLFTFDDTNYFLVNDWSRSKIGYFLLFRLDTEKNRVNSYLPFSNKDYDNNRGWGLEKYYNLYDNRALLCFSTLNTIYHLTPSGEISPRYELDILYKKMPDEIRTGDGEKAIKSWIESGYIMGISNIAETSRFLFLRINGGNHTIVYDKKEKEVKAISTDFVIPSFCDTSFRIQFTQDEGDTILTYITGLYAANTRSYFAEEKAKGKWTKGDGTNAFEREFIKVLKNVQDEEDNPIVLFFKARQ